MSMSPDVAAESRCLAHGFPGVRSVRVVQVVRILKHPGQSTDSTDDRETWSCIEFPHRFHLLSLVVFCRPGAWLASLIVYNVLRYLHFRGLLQSFSITVAGDPARNS